ncbi:hypothetical protein IT413_02650 [Candidatus Peregrinibacteria bacterium]|nr:hypothetical protein [Candidatus Peregrinibacteria bacterium]
MSEKISDPKLAAVAELEGKTPTQPPVSPRTGRTHDDIDKLPDVHSAVTSDIYRKLEALQEAFFPVDQTKRFAQIKPEGLTDDKFLAEVENNPFHTQLIYELLRRMRKGIIPVGEAARYYTESKKHKRNLVDNVIARIDAGVITFEKLPNGKLESLQLREFLKSLFDTDFITPEDVLEYNHNPELDIFIKQYLDEINLPAVKPGQKAFPTPILAPAVLAAPDPNFRVPGPKRAARKPTIPTMAVPPPAIGSAPGAPSSVIAPPPPSAQTDPSRKFSSTLMLGSVDPAEAPPASQAALTVREGAGRTSPKDTRAAMATIADSAATAEALGRDQTKDDIQIIATPPEIQAAIVPPPAPVGVAKSSSDQTVRHLPPPVPTDDESIDQVDENLYQAMHAVTIIGNPDDLTSTIDVPLLLQDGEFTIGTNPRNDIVVQNPPGSESVAEFHGVIKISGDKIMAKGLKGPMKVAQKPDRRGLIMHSYVPVEAGEPIMIGRVNQGKVDQYVVVNVKLDQVFLNEEIKTQLSERCKNLLRCAGQKIVEALQEADLDKPDLADKNSDEAKALTKKASEAFQALTMRLPGEVKDKDFNTWRNIALSEAQLLLSKRLTTLIIHYGEELAKSMQRRVQDAFDSGTEIASIEIETAPPKFFTDYFNFARSHGIHLSKENYNQELDRAKSEARRYLAEKKKVEADMKEADKRKAELEDELKNRPQREHQRALEHFNKQYAGVHYREHGDGKELLTMETKFAHVGPVIVVCDSTGAIVENGLRPLLIDHQTIGTHDINTIELPPDHDPKRGAKPFMVSIEFDEKLGEYRMTWIDGAVAFITKEIPMSPVFTLENGKPVCVGKYLVKIEQNHAFTAGSITAEYANPQVEELTEIIFDHAITTLEQTATTYDELKTLATTGHVNMTALKSHLTIRITELWNRLAAWNPDLNIQKTVDPDAAPVTPGKDHQSILADAQALGTLHLLLADRGSFIPKVEGITQAAVVDEAKRRLDAYVKFDAKAKEAGPKFKKIMGLFSMGKARIAQQESQKAEASLRADVGVLEIARFLDMGIFKQEIVNSHPGISEEYCDRINEVHRIRQFIDEIRKGGKEVEHLEDAMKLCGAKTMEEIFGQDEIAAFNVNIEVNVTAKTPVIQYLKKLCVFLGRKHLRLLGNVDNQKSITTIEKLLEIKAVTYDDLIIPPYLLGSEVQSKIEEAKYIAQMNKETEKEQAIIRTKKAEAFQQQVALKIKYRQGLVDKFAHVVDTVGRAQQEVRLDILLEVADIIRDPQVEEEMDGDGISMEMIRYAKDLPTEHSKFKNRAVAIVADRKQVGWHTVKADFSTTAIKSARVAAEKIMAADPDADYQLDLLQEAIQKGIVSPTDIGYTADQLAQKVNQDTLKRKEKTFRMKYKSFFDQHQGLSADNLEYLDQVDLDSINDPVEANALLEIIETISYIRMESILENIKSGNDPEYMKIVGNELIEKGYRAQLHFKPERLALLQ